MGMYDTMQQAATPMNQPVNGTSAQKSSPGSQHMRGRGMSPASSGQKNVQAGVSAGFTPPRPNPNQGTMQNMAQGAGNVANAWQQNRMQKPVGHYGMPGGMRPNPTAGQVPGMGGSQSMMQQKMQQLRAKELTGTIGGSYSQLVGQRPDLAANRASGEAAGQDMSWMDKPGALQMGPQKDPNNQILQAYSGGGMTPLQTPYDQQQSAPQQTPMQAAIEQMRGYDGPDMGSQDPRELARMGQMGQLQGSVGQPMLQNAPFGGEQPGSNSFQSMMESMGGQRPDVMSRGLGPSMMQMDENGMEQRRGPR